LKRIKDAVFNVDRGINGPLIRLIIIPFCC